MKRLAILALLLLGTLTAGAEEVLPFIADDYVKAKALARARNVPIFVEAWAPW